MFEKVNPMHPDKIADRIAGAIVDLAYAKNENPHIAVEVLIGHGNCHIISETDTHVSKDNVENAVHRIAGCEISVTYDETVQDIFLHANQRESPRCGDNGIFKGMPVTDEQRTLTDIANRIFTQFPTDGKYIKNSDTLIICQSHAKTSDLKKEFPDAVINPLGDWFGGVNVDSGATNRKLGSDMGDSITGGGLHGKDLSKADVSVNIYAFLKAQETGKEISLFCAIGDDSIDGRQYSEIVEIARNYIKAIGGFEKFAEWGLIRNG